jgi:hypothetical protein
MLAVHQASGSVLPLSCEVATNKLIDEEFSWMSTLGERPIESFFFQRKKSPALVSLTVQPGRHYQGSEAC